MSVLDLEPADDKPPFARGDDAFYCNLCRSYTPNFAPSSIKNRDRRCRTCLAKKRFERMQQIGHVQRLKTKLYHNLIYKGKPSLAKALTVGKIDDLLTSYGISRDDYALVKTIKITFDPVNRKWIPLPVFYELSRLVKDEET